MRLCHCGCSDARRPSLPLAPVGSSSNRLRDRRGDFSTFSVRTVLHAIERIRARFNLRNYPHHKSTKCGIIPLRPGLGERRRL